MALVITVLPRSFVVCVLQTFASLVLPLFEPFTENIAKQ